MPTYEYVCTQCGHRLEAVQSFSDAPLTECPVCSGHLRKVFSPVGVVFKGSGFYRTDSRAAGSGDGRDGAKSGAKTDAKTDTKTDAKTDAKPGGKPEAKSDTPAAKTESSTATKTA